MRRRSGLTLIVIAGAATLAIAFGTLTSARDRTDRGATLTSASATNRCTAPVLTSARARWGGERGLRVKLRIRARATNGRINAAYVRWGDGPELVVDVIQRRRVSVEVAHRYAHGGRYRISVTAEQIAPGCGFRKSRPSTVVVRVPLPRP